MVMLHGQVAYQIKGNEVYNNMLANILTLHKSLTPVVGSKGQLFCFSESSHILYQINGNDASNCSVLLYTLDPWVESKGQKTFFF